MSVDVRRVNILIALLVCWSIAIATTFEGTLIWFWPVLMLAGIALRPNPLSWLRKWLMLSFIVFAMALGVPLFRGWETGSALFVVYLQRGLLAVGAATLFSEVVPAQHLVRALASWRLPSVLTQALGLMLRFGDIFSRERTTLLRARSAREFQRASWISRAHIASEILLRSLDRVERVHRAMQSRSGGTNDAQTGRR